LAVRERAVSDVVDELKSIKDKLISYSKSSYEIHEKLSSCKNIMFEGAQGALLDVAFGTYPFVTSSNTILGQVALGSCASSDCEALGVLKAYTTRVGEGPFPTELNDEIGDFLRLEGAEIGTVTGRNRRCGWFDSALVKHTMKLSSIKKIALTKLDVLDKLDKIKICTGYKIGDEKYEYFPQNISLWDKIIPIYEELEGWKCSTKEAKSRGELPQKAQNYISRIEELCGVKSVIISTGARREETIEVL
jgi:adenylosuccinate synthase